jgi:hypothetical protein
MVKELSDQKMVIDTRRRRQTIEVRAANEV